MNPTQTHEDSNIGLTMEDKIVALLKWMGWDFEIEDGKQYWSHADHPEASELPPLTLDLMFDAEEKLKREDWDGFCNMNELLACKILKGDEHVFHATKEQRLEALLKTIGAA